MSVRVLLAEDEWIIAAAIRRQVEAHGYQITDVVGTGKAALEACGRDLPDVVFMDVQMPEMDGITATQRMMEQCPCPVVIVTGHAGQREAAGEAGAMEFVVKPVLTREIPAIIERARRRFERFQIVHRGHGACREAVGAWVEVQQAVRSIMGREGTSEEAAFARLQELAAERKETLEAAARRISVP